MVRRQKTWGDDLRTKCAKTALDLNLVLLVTDLAVGVLC